MEITFYCITFEEKIIYIGSTKNFKKREMSHQRRFLEKYNYEKQNQIYLYKYMRNLSNNLSSFTFKILDILILDNENRLKKEKDLITIHSPICNKKTPISTYEERIYKIRVWQDRNKEYLDEKHKQKNICEICGGKYTHANKSIHLKTLKHLSKISNE
jgi:hypothetical protein